MAKIDTLISVEGGQDEAGTLNTSVHVVNRDWVFHPQDIAGIVFESQITPGIESE